MADKNFGVKGIDFISDPGTPTISIASSAITYAGSLNLNAPTVAISRDVTIGGNVASNVIVSNNYSVGIGTTVLTEKLNVNGNVNVSGIVSATRFVGSGTSLTGLVSNQLSSIDTNYYQYLLLTQSQTGTSSTISSSANYITFNPAANYLGIGTNTPAAGLDVNGTGRFVGTVTAPTFQGTATTATNLADAANITTGTISASRLSGTYNITISGNVATASTASGLTTTASVNTSGIITATGGFVGSLTGTATTASGLTTSININTSGIITSTGGFVGSLTGIASTATQLQTTRYFSVSGDVSTGSSVAFNGTQNVGLAVTLALSGVTSATYGSSTSIPSISVNDKGIVTGVTTSGITVGDGTLDLKTSGTGLTGIATFTANQATGTAVTFTVTSNATHLNTASAIVARDVSGNFRAGIITATTFSGTATTATGLTTTANVNTTGIITASQFSTGISTQNIGFSTDRISGPSIIYIDPYSVGLSTGTVRITGNLQVDGTTVTASQATIQSPAKTIGIAISETNDIALDGAGIGIGSASIQKTLLWNYGSSALKTSENFNLSLGKVYQINDNEVLSSTALAPSVITASGITSVGTLQQLVVSNNTSTNLVRITQTGSGSALIVEDEASPDGTAFIVSANGSIGIGTTIPEYKLTITNNALPTSGLTHAIADFTGSVDGYTQLNIRNSLAAASASADLIATADTGSDTTNFIDLGINNSAFSSGSWTVNGALDGYLYTSDGSLSIGVATSNTAKYLSFFAGGVLAANEQVRVTQTGVGIGTINPTSKLHVAGDVRITGVSTLGVTTATNLTSQRLNVSGIATVGFLTATNAYIGVATVGFITATNAYVSGISTYTNTLNVVPTSTGIAGLFSGTTSGDMVRITQLGSGNALVVEDEANPDTTPFVITSTGRVGINTTTPSTALQLNGTLSFGSGNNIKIGDSNTGSSLTGALNNIFIGPNAGAGNTNAYGNIYLGSQVARSQTSGSYNVVIGNGAATLAPESGGSLSVILGESAGFYNSGSFNTFLGSSSGGGNTSGSQNVFIGGSAGAGNTNNSNSVNIGMYAGQNTNGANNVLIGYAANAPILTGSNQLVIGNGSNRWIVGNSSYNVGIGTTNPTSKLHVQGDAYITGGITATDFDSLSDFNLKTNIQQIDDSLSKVIQIRGVTFNWKDTNRGSAGVIAQEVEKVLPELVSGEEIKTVNYNGVIGALVEAVKELKVENDVLRERLDEVYKEVFG